MHKYLEHVREFWRYNHAHRKAVLDVERRCVGHNTLLTRMHDLDKFIMCIFLVPDDAISRIHRFLSWHHPNNKVGWFRLDEAIFDWESARFTKPDKPLNARDTCLKYYPELKERVFQRCDEWNI